MNENNIRTLLRDIADDLEPAPRISISRARRGGLRRLWARRTAISVTGLAALAAAVTIPHALTASSAGRAATAPAASATTKAKPKASPKAKATTPTVPSPDGYLNPLVPYAAFGWLPAGYSLDITPSAIHDGFVSTVDSLTLTAAQSPGGYFIQLSVLPKDGCYGLLQGIPGWSTTQAQADRCGLLGGQVSGRAPDLNGRIAYWGAGGDALAWQYAPDSWAVLQAQSSGNSAFPASEASTLLPQIAAAVKYGQTQPILFPFKVSGVVPPDWHAVSATYDVTASGQYLASVLDAAPYLYYENHGVSGLIISAAATPGADGSTCQGGSGSSTQQIDGESWIIQLPGTAQPGPALPGPTPPSDNATACTPQPADGLYANADLKTDTTGAAGTGGITSVLNHLTLLGADSSAWTSGPLAS
jgi:hypothetical protein